MSPRHFLALALATFPLAASATYLVISKDLYHYQALYSTPELDATYPGSLFAELYDDEGFNLTNATLTSPDGTTVIPLEPSDYDGDGQDDDFTFYDIYGTADDFSTTGKYRNGTYSFAMTPTHAGTFTVALTGNNYPDAPSVADPYNADAFDATKANSIKILPFLGVVASDYITATVYDDQYDEVYSFTGIADSATTLTIPANTLSADSYYLLSITYNKRVNNTVSGNLERESFYSSSTDIEIDTLPTGTVYLPAQAMPDGRGGVSYTGTMTGVTGTGPFTYSLASGSLPPGLTLGPSTGTIAGVIGPHAADTEYEFDIRVTNGSKSYTAPFVIPVRPNGSGGTPPVQEFGIVKVRTNTQSDTSSLPVADSYGHYVDIFASGFSARGLGDANVTMPVSTNFAARGRHLQRTYPLDAELSLSEYASSLAELTSSFPASSNYTFNFNARTSGSVAFSSTVNSGADAYPEDPIFTGSIPTAIDPASALPVSWTLWTSGKAGTEQFVELAVIDSETGEEVFGTDAPWETSPTAVKLAGTSTGATIPAGTLEAGKSYELKLTFYNVLSKTTVAVSGFNSALALAGRGNTTYLPITTTAAQSTLGTWATSFTLPSGSDTFGSDPDDDGLSNLVEYAFLGDPNDPTNPLATEFDALTDAALTAASPIKPGPVVTADAVNNTVTIRHPLRKNVADLAYLYQTSPDCVTWSSVTPVSRTVIYGDATRELVDVVLPLTPEVGKSNVFVRLKVEFTEPVGAP